MASHQSPLISIPKKTTEDVDWTTPIRQMIAGSFGEAPDQYSEECAVLQRCRQDAVKGAGSDQTARDLLYKYFGQLELLELRFAEIKVSFPWNDAFTSKQTTQTSLAFEKASVIHLIASVLSSLAAESSRSDPEGLKRAYHHSRASAGMLTYINENFLHAPSTDLSRDVVHLLIGITLAQASEIFVEKVVQEKKGPGIIARLAAQVGGMYTTLVDDAKEFQGKSILDRSWLFVLQIKAKLFPSLAHYYKAIADHASGDHGAGLVRMTVAHNLAMEAMRQAQSFTYTFSSAATTTLPHDAATALVEITKAHQALCLEQKNQAAKDNDLIYHAILPSETSLPPVEKLAAATPITIQEIYANPDVSKLIGPDIFIRLVPLAVHESASIYSEEKAKLVRAEVERVDMAEGEVRAGLEHLGLPNNLRKWSSIIDPADGSDNQDGVSDGLRQWATEIEHGERSGSVAGLLRRLEDERGRCEREMSEISRELETESRECERMRATHSQLWTQQPSAPLTRHFRTNLQNNQSFLAQATATNQHVFALWESIRDDIALLARGDASIQSHAASVAAGQPRPTQGSLLDLDDGGMASSGGLDDGEREQARAGIANIRDKLDRLSKIRKERDEVLKDLKEKIQNDDVSNLLLLNRRTQNVEPQLFANELEKFRPYQNRIAAAIAASGSIVQELEQDVKSIERGKGMKERGRAGKDRERRLREWERKLGKAAEGYGEVRTGLDKGLAFYESLSGHVDNLRREVRSFVAVRAEERDRLAKDLETRSRIASPTSPSLESRLGDMGLGGKPFPPPPPSRSPYQPTPPPATSPPPRTAASPYDFSSLGGGLPSAFSMNSTASPPPPAPAPPIQRQQGPYPPPPSSSYPPVASSSTASYSTYQATSSQSPYPPPPPRPSQYPAPPPAPQHPSYPAPPAQHAYSSPPVSQASSYYPAPPVSKQPSSYAAPANPYQSSPQSYAPPQQQQQQQHYQPQQPQQQQQQYSSQQPPAPHNPYAVPPNAFGAHVPPPQQPQYPQHPPPQQQQQHSQHPSYPQGYGQAPQQQQGYSPYGYPSR